jgi:chromate transporter
VFVLGGGRYFDLLRANRAVQAFLAGAGPAAIGAILGSAVLLGVSISHLWQVPVLVAATIWLLALRRAVVTALIGAGLIGFVAALAGLPVG